MEDVFLCSLFSSPQFVLFPLIPPFVSLSFSLSSCQLMSCHATLRDKFLFLCWSFFAVPSHYSQTYQAQFWPRVHFCIVVFLLRSHCGGRKLGSSNSHTFSGLCCAHTHRPFRKAQLENSQRRTFWAFKVSFYACIVLFVCWLSTVWMTKGTE